jgi:GTP pyrophosphokinase
MLNQNVSFDVYDKLRFIVYKANPHDEKFLENIFYCNRPLSSSPSRLRDWISSKSTGYEALHITVMGPKGRWVEVQVRSERMDEIAEKRICSSLQI